MEFDLTHSWMSLTPDGMLHRRVVHLFLSDWMPLMIRGLLGRTREVPIRAKGLNRVISVDTEGEAVRVKDLLATRNKRTHRPSDPLILSPNL